LPLVTAVAMRSIKAAVGIPDESGSFPIAKPDPQRRGNPLPARLEPRLDVMDDGGMRLDERREPDVDFEVYSDAQDLGRLDLSEVHTAPDRCAFLWTEKAFVPE
jgi:hypothetical protein